ncbi:lytic transglycosylase domain-containing protein [Alisedimentitalea sp. MJ-SS2]|uniref:lytic transglycosylase domain-containing protein n=1 Tax=Aliisedimentitalea sp. MJ-SS2 TaxID=3049795 RepID=UPI0029131001|nr:lytic transglycosylase domain-containing protein [Alisedimentitalea sp. MJ-SS2]MDU8929133.1 lytic transglycosylase domain-containing protein [Alisedimentitalea sp. MJ-SS2]
MTHQTRRTLLFAAAALALTGCSNRSRPNPAASSPTPTTLLYPNETPELRALIVKYAKLYQVPLPLVQRVIIRESTHRPHARNGPYYGLMQILPETARTMGFRGQPSDLLDAETNLKYAVKYLRGAWLVSGGDMDKAVMWYARGYYYEAKRLGLLKETGLRP